MKTILMTMRVDVSATGERRDTMDQRWAAFLVAAGFTAVPVPNHLETALALARHIVPRGIILTGGNDLAAYGGDAPERDETELALLEWAMRHAVPVAGVCRGMQFIQHYFGVALARVTNHVAVNHAILLDGRSRDVNSYHNWGATETVPELTVTATAADGVIEAVRHVTRPIEAMMWHPERFDPFEPEDIAWLKVFFRNY